MQERTCWKWGKTWGKCVRRIQEQRPLGAKNRREDTAAPMLRIVRRPAQLERGREEVRKREPRKPGNSPSWNPLQVLGFHKEKYRKNRRNGHCSQKTQQPWTVISWTISWQSGKSSRRWKSKRLERVGLGAKNRNPFQYERGFCLLPAKIISQNPVKGGQGWPCHAVMYLCSQFLICIGRDFNGCNCKQPIIKTVLAINCYYKSLYHT